jgi:hypothetical protein
MTAFIPATVTSSRELIERKRSESERRRKESECGAMFTPHFSIFPGFEEKERKNNFPESLKQRKIIPHIPLSFSFDAAIFRIRTA